MGVKLNWTGLLIIMAGGTFGVPAAAVVGAVVFLVGVIFMWLDR